MSSEQLRRSQRLGVDVGKIVDAGHRVDVKFPIKFGGALESEFEENCFTAQLDGLDVPLGHSLVHPSRRLNHLDLEQSHWNLHGSKNGFMIRHDRSDLVAVAIEMSDELAESGFNFLCRLLLDCHCEQVLAVLIHGKQK